MDDSIPIFPFLGSPIFPFCWSLKHKIKESQAGLLGVPILKVRVPILF